MASEQSVLSQAGTMSDAEIIGLMERLIDNGTIGLYPQRNDCGADQYICPGCYKSTPTEGYASGTTHLTSGKHKTDCELMRLLNAIQQRQSE